MAELFSQIVRALTLLAWVTLSPAAPSASSAALPVTPAVTAAEEPGPDATCRAEATAISDAINALDFAAAIAQAAAAEDACPDDPMIAHLTGVAHYKRYEALFNGGDPEAADDADVYRALGALSRSALLDPTYTEVYFYRGLVFASLGEYAHALLDYDTAIELDPASPFAYYARGYVHEQMANTPAAIADYRRFLDRYPVVDHWQDDAAQRLRGLEKQTK